jgi:hypothetical protein
MHLDLWDKTRSIFCQVTGKRRSAQKRDWLWCDVWCCVVLCGVVRRCVAMCGTVMVWVFGYSKKSVRMFCYLNQKYVAIFIIYYSVPLNAFKAYLPCGVKNTFMVAPS